MPAGLIYKDRPITLNYRRQSAGKMGVTVQILTGCILLGLCSMIHIAILIWLATFILRLRMRLERLSRHAQLGTLIGCAFAAISFSHIAQISIWAFSISVFGALPDIGESIYFSLATYTTLGYGDITLGPDFRVFGSVAAITGVLNFGLSTAFLVGLLTRLFQEHYS
jgi:hypothetical protein